MNYPIKIIAECVKWNIKSCHQGFKMGGNYFEMTYPHFSSTGI